MRDRQHEWDRRRLQFYLQNVNELAGQVGYVSLPEETYKLTQERFQDCKIDRHSLFEGGAEVGVSIRGLLRREQRAGDTTQAGTTASL